MGTVAVVPATGMALLLFHELLHEGASVIQGEKYVLRTDIIMYEADKGLWIQISFV
ncbi:hypothetical protein CAL7716_063640 [Calothrix sp. PCC 7716]|nr:hypothetical protein CAL7716_063640 [Calothrix sp. PCC 7716]